MKNSTLTVALLALALMLPFERAVAQFDHQHKAWTALLVNNVVLIAGGQGSQLH